MFTENKYISVVIIGNFSKENNQVQFAVAHDTVREISII
jgi:hypothetical protein